VTIGASVGALLIVDLYLVVRRGAAVGLRSCLGPGLLFTVVFAVVVAVRAVDPAIYAHSGEMFLNFGLLKSLERATSLPPEDVWMAGEPVRCYYGGHLLGSILARLTTMPVRYAYNLHLPTIVAALATASYGIAGAIGASHGVSHRLAGLAGVFFTNVASNVFGPLQLLARQLPEPIATDVAELANVDPALFTTAQFSYTQGSGFRPHFAPLDFPLFSTFHGGFHPQVMSPPFLLLLGALLFAYYRTPAVEQRRRWGLLGAAVPVLGFVLLTNSWSFPTACGLVLLGVALAPARLRTLLPGWVVGAETGTAGEQRLSTDGGAAVAAARRAVTDFGGGFAVAVALGLGGMAVVAPYYGRLTGGLEPGFFPDRSGLAVLVLVHGAFLLVLCWYLWPHVRQLLAGEPPTARADARTVSRRTVALAISVGANLLFLGVALDAASFAVYGTLAVVGATLLVLSLSLWGGVVAADHFGGTTPLYAPMYNQTDDPTLDALEPEGERHAGEMAAIQ
jgi:uncharacterized membrane protein